MKQLKIPKIPLKKKVSISRYTIIVLFLYMIGFSTGLLQLYIDYDEAMTIQLIITSLPILFIIIGVFLPLEKMDEFYGDNFIVSILLAILINVAIYLPILSFYSMRGIIKGRWLDINGVIIKNPMLLIDIMSATAVLIEIIIFLYLENRNDRKNKVISNVAILREKAGIDQKEFCQLTQLRANSVDKLEKGVYRPGLRTSLKICKVLNADITEIFSES